ncbi:MAG TPA: bi-domain-containing oxidoreductase [Pyrinomonadaceae bacterium]|nr:bi-domain-containing oxidoreductase [Pyrinomonadaceae bacterium]
MKQILHNLGTGEAVVADVPAPATQPGRVLVRAAASLISAGTERAVVELGRKSLAAKAKERPDLVRKVIEKVREEGLKSALGSVREKLAASHALGYSAAGVVAEVGAGVSEFRPGDRVACAGTGYASHAEVLSVPKNLCVRLPDEVEFEAAAFSTLGAVALQGVRLAEPTLGESVVVVGLGLLGQLAVQLLRANGCRVYGVDPDPSRVRLALAHGACGGAEPGADAKEAVMRWSRGRGADAVILTAATSSDEPLRFAAEVSRLKGRVVAVGGVGMTVPRELFFARELTFRVSMSYGPGRYDPEYEERGRDYPFPYVRWTEGRNLEAFLDLLASGRVDTKALITHRFPVGRGAEAYRLISGETKEPYLGVVIGYDHEREAEPHVEARPRRDVGSAHHTGAVRIGFVGAGAYAQKFLLPSFRAEGAEFVSITTSSGVTARDVGERYGFARYVSGSEAVVADDEVNLVVVATPHDSHAALACAALEAGRHVFVEKPLALDDEQLDAVLAAAEASAGSLTVGFNRRFSPHARRAREVFAGRRAPLSILYRVNSGRVPRTHWVQDPATGGGRIIGEVCHFVDLMQFLVGSPVVRVHAESVSARDHEVIEEDSVFITLRFADGSNGSIAYLAEGDRSLRKERVEIFGEGRAFVIEDFRAASLHAGGRERRERLRTQDKGQAALVRAACAHVRGGGEAPTPLAGLEATTRATFRILDALRTGEPQAVTLGSARA